MPFTNVYDVTFPADTQLANLLGSDARSLALNVQQRMAAISGLSSAQPNFAGDAQPSNWTGILFFATDNGHVYQFNGAVWVDITTSLLAARMLVSQSGSAVGVPASSTWFFDLIGNNLTSTEPPRQAPMPQAGTFRALYVLTNTAQPASGSLTVGINIGGVPQAIQVVIPASGGAGVYSDTAHSVPFVAGNLVDIQGVNSATAPAAVIQNFSLLY
jgi:hypothetical protein